MRSRLVQARCRQAGSLPEVQAAEVGRCQGFASIGKTAGHEEEGEGLEVRIAALVLMCAAVAVAADPPSTSCGYRNGRFWADLDMFAKLAYLQGVSDGASAGNIYAKYFPGGSLTFGDLRAAVDTVYRDPANVLVSIIEVVKVAKSRFEGTSPTIVEYGLSLSRQRAMACSENK